MELYCANKLCRWHKERRGGKFYHRGDKWYCDECAREYTIAEPGKNLWEFETTNISGATVHVKSLGHLRQLERQHGVVSVAANFDSKSWNHPPQQQHRTYTENYWRGK